MGFQWNEDDDAAMSEINMTPLVDVMLVLLIIFIITVPVMKHAVPVELPRASSQAPDPAVQSVRLTVDAQGDFYFNEARVSDEELDRLLREQAARQPQPQVQLKGDRSVRYERVAQALAAVQRAGLQNIGFVTERR
ncbi:MAG: putative biopolymer transport protein [Pseudomonadota bacterium]